MSLFVMSAPTRAQEVCHTFSNLATKVQKVFDICKKKVTFCTFLCVMYRRSGYV